MAIKCFIESAIIESDHDGYISVDIKNENGAWLELHNDKNFPLVIETDRDIEEFAKQLKMLLKCANEKR